MLKWIDIPPVWLAGCVGLAWLEARYIAPGLGIGIGLGWGVWLGFVLIGSGLLLFVLALIRFRHHRTTPIPHQMASHLITDGIFARSRNPIYLGDALILTGFILLWGGVLSFALVPVFMWIIAKRFISAEEARLQAAFGAQFLGYCKKTRRWL